MRTHFLHAQCLHFSNFSSKNLEMTCCRVAFAGSMPRAHGKRKSIGTAKNLTTGSTIPTCRKFTLNENIRYTFFSLFTFLPLPIGAKKNMLIVRNLRYIKKKYAWEQFITVLWWYCMSRFVTSWLTKNFSAPYFLFPLIFPFSGMW